MKHSIKGQKPPVSKTYHTLRIVRIKRCKHLTIEIRFYRDRVQRSLKAANDKTAKRFFPEKQLAFSDVLYRVPLDSFMAPYTISGVLAHSKIELDTIVSNVIANESKRNKSITAIRQDDDQSAITNTTDTQLSKLPDDSPMTVVAEGIYLDSGYAVRQLPTGSCVQYFVDVETNSKTFEVKRIWGSDLKRAIEDALIMRSTFIKVTELGWKNLESPSPNQATQDIERRMFNVVAL